MQARPDASLGLAGYLVASMCMQGQPDKLYLYISGFPMYPKNDNISGVWVFELEALGWTKIHLRPDM